MRTVSSPMRFATGAIRSSNLSPSPKLDDLRSSRLGQARRLRREVLELRLAVRRDRVGRDAPWSNPFCGARCLRGATVVRVGAGSLPLPSWRAMKAASSATKPSSAEPRVCCQERPRKYSPGTSVTPRRWRRRPVFGRHRQLDPRVVWPVAGRPDHGVDFQLATVGEADRAAVGADGARPHLDADALHLPRARADQGVAAP